MCILSACTSLNILPDCKKKKKKEMHDLSQEDKDFD